MKYLKKNLLNKKFLENEIRENLKFIINNINFNTKVINIHIQKGEGFIYDYPRMFFIIHLISRLHKNNLINFGEKELHISKRTVEMHFRRIHIKLEVTNTKAAIFAGFREGLIV
jgi:hypothetical protein